MSQGAWGPFSDDHVFCAYKPVDEFDSGADELIETIKSVVYSGNYISFYEFMQFVFRHDHCTIDFIDEIDNCLQLANSAFRVVNRDTLMPVASPEEMAAVTQAFVDASAAGLGGARIHLQAAAEALTFGQYTDSIAKAFMQSNRPRKLLPLLDTLVTHWQF